MKKSLLAVAIASAMAAPAVMAEVDIYGKIAVSVEAAKSNQLDASGNKTNVNTARVSDEESRIGFKGAEDLGNGLKANWQVESRIRPDDGGATQDTYGFASRNSYVGLSSSFGAIKLGRYDSPYKSLTNVNLNVLGNGVSDQSGSNGYNPTAPAAGSGVFGQDDARLKNTVLYESPVFAGFQGKLAYGTGENKTATVGNINVWSGSMTYTADLFELGAAYQQAKNGQQNYSNPTNGGKIDSYKLYGGLKLDALYLGAGYENIKVAGYTDPNNGKQKNWLLSGTYTLGATKLLAQYGEARDFSNSTATDTGSKQWSLGASYDLSKRTMVRAYYTELKNEKNATRDFNVNPVGNGVPSTTGMLAGGKAQVFNVGLSHSF